MVAWLAAWLLGPVSYSPLISPILEYKRREEEEEWLHG